MGPLLFARLDLKLGLVEEGVAKSEIRASRSSGLQSENLVLHLLLWHIAQGLESCQHTFL